MNYKLTTFLLLFLLIATIVYFTAINKADKLYFKVSSKNENGLLTMNSVEVTQELLDKWQQELNEYK
jgi:hypothetical protein